MNSLSSFCRSFLGLSLLLLASAGAAQTIPVSADTYTRSTIPDSNFGGSSVVRVRSTSHAGWLFFDLTSLDPGDVLSATLRMRIQRVISGAGSITVHEVMAPWAEDSLTFNNAPAFSVIPEALMPIVPSNPGTIVDVDITALVAGWAAEPASNFGLTLQPPASGIAMEFNSAEGGFPAELIIELGNVVKPNFATVEQSGGDYENPLDAISSIDTWCDTASLSMDSKCRILIGPGIFQLSAPLLLPAFVDVIGAGKSGTRRTELAAMPEVDTVVFLNEAVASNTISDLRIVNTAGNALLAVGIGTVESAADNIPTISNVSIEVSGAEDHYGILSRFKLKLNDIDIKVSGGDNTWNRGIHSDSAIAERIQIDLFLDPQTSNSLGWSEYLDATGATEISDFRINVHFSGDLAEAVGGGFRSGRQNQVTLINGVIQVFGLGIEAESGLPFRLSNVQISAGGGVRVGTADLPGTYEIDNLNFSTRIATVLAPVWAISIGGDDTVVRIRNSNLIARDQGILLSSAPGTTLEIDGSIVEGGEYSIERLDSVDNGTVISIGGSKIVGPMFLNPQGPTADFLTCEFVYDENYEPIVCE